MLKRGLRRVGLLTLWSFSSASLLRSQAPVPGGSSVTPDLPRFTVREIVAGRRDSLALIPGRWVMAASAAVPETLSAASYRDAALRSGVTPLEGSNLTSQRSQHVMGLYRRAELTDALRRTLESIRLTLPSAAVQARFDRLFRPRGEWIVDLHDAALAWARARVPGIGWESARRSLTGSHWLQRGDSLTSDEAVLRALYGLSVLAATDSAAFSAVRSDLGRADSVSAAAVQVLLQGYAESRQWFTDVLSFFLTESWVPDGRQGRSLADYVLADWRRIQSRAIAAPTPIPQIRARLFGYPQAVPHYGVPPSLFDRLVVLDNSSAHAWVQQHGQAALLSALRQLPPGDTSLVLVQAGSEAIRLTTLPRQARENLNGFLEPRDAIAIDPGYSPLLALGTVVHEWQHLIFRHRQLDAFAAGLRAKREQLALELPGMEPYMAEGFAEWSTERILAPLVQRWPLLALGELEKRAGLAREGPGEQHTMGYALVRALAAELPGSDLTTDILLRHADNPAAVVAEPALRRAWRKHGRAADRVFTVPARRVLIPEITFTIEDGFPDVISSRILVPVSSKPRP